MLGGDVKPLSLRSTYYSTEYTAFAAIQCLMSCATKWRPSKDFTLLRIHPLLRPFWSSYSTHQRRWSWDSLVIIMINKTKTNSFLHIEIRATYKPVEEGECKSSYCRKEFWYQLLIHLICGTAVMMSTMSIKRHVGFSGRSKEHMSIIFLNFNSEQTFNAVVGVRKVWFSSLSYAALLRRTGVVAMQWIQRNGRCLLRGNRGMENWHRIIQRTETLRTGFTIRKQAWKGMRR
jgi:hypothetical protein